MSGFILWLTGLSGAGKSTLANALAEHLPRAEILDGDEVRKTLCAGLGFSREDRDTNVHRIAYVARLLARHDVAVIVAAISPYRETRAAIRGFAAAADIAFVEVYVNAPIDALAARDPKGLYKRALAGEVPYFTGVSDPYEAPLAPDVEVHTARETVAASTTTILAALHGRGLIARRTI